MKLFIGKKLNMSSVYGDDGKIIPVTEVKVGRGVIVQVKNTDKDGYNAVQIGFEEGSKRVNKSLGGHVKGLAENPLLKEVKVENPDNFKAGQECDVASFEKGEKVSVAGLSKGRGFQGVVKRYGFHGADKTHGTKHNLRAPGSIGSTDPERVFPGIKMAGRMGGARVSIKNLEIVDINTEQGVIKVKGAIPGARGGLIEILGEGDIKPVDNKNSVEKNDDNSPVDLRNSSNENNKEQVKQGDKTE